MQLNLTRPIVFFDLETTGVQVGTDRIVEICLHKVLPDQQCETLTLRVRPVDDAGNTLHIPAEASAVHGIFDADVAHEPSFRELAPRLQAFIGDADLAGFNSNKFDIPMLVEEFYRAGIDFDVSRRHLVDVQNIFHKMEQRTLVAAYAFYCNKNLDDAHSALGDVRATYEVLKAQLDKYEGTLQNDVKFLADFTTRNRQADYAGRIVLNEKDEPVFNFGKHKGRRVIDVLRSEPSYYDWMMNGDFTLDTKKVLTDIYLESKNKA